jgi:prepilin-type N-terminal cleavage/methylation domain-containing protein
MIFVNRAQSGLTLIEVLVTLTILSFLSVITWSVFFQGYNFSQKAISKNSMIQETNLLITNLNKIHQTMIKYEFKSENCEIKVTNLNSTPQQTQIFNHSNICFKILEINAVLGQGPKTVEPNKTANDVSLKISASDKNNPQNSITQDTFLYRMKGADYQ